MLKLMCRTFARGRPFSYLDKLFLDIIVHLSSFMGQRNTRQLLVRIILKDDDASYSDVWSFGTVLLELYTHTPVFRGDSPQNQIGAIMKVEIMSLKWCLL